MILYLGNRGSDSLTPQIDWRSQQIEVASNTQIADVDGPTFCENQRHGAYANILQVKVTHVEHQVTAQALQAILDKFSDVFLDQLPDVMPSPRDINFELQMKPDKVPGSRAPFRLSKVEQDALQEFVDENLRKGWIEARILLGFKHLWYFQKRPNNLHVFQARGMGNSKIPIRWVIDYRYVNSSG